jgi:hypothetical protein
MAFDIGGNLAEVGAMLIPIVGSIALFSFLAVATWADARRKEREAYYTGETLKKISESSGQGASAAIEMLREQQREAVRHRRDGQRLGGLITAAVGLGVIIFLRALVRDEPVYLAGVIPLLIGLALLVYSYALASKE